MHRDVESVRPEHVLLEQGFRPEHLTPRERRELAERLRGWPELGPPSRDGHGAHGHDRRGAHSESSGRQRA
jgi:hypothetical protein